MAKKRILHFISGLEIGGTEMQLLGILPELQKYHENRVCCLRGHGPIGSKLEKRGIKVYYLNFKNIFYFFLFLRFRDAIRDFSPDILVTYLIHADLYGRIFGKLFGIKKIICSKRGALLQWEWLSSFDRLTKRLVSHYLVQTETATREWMKKLKLAESKFTVIPNGIDIQAFKIKINQKEKRRQLGISENLFVMTCVSKLRRGKGHNVLLKAFEKVYRQNKNIVLLLVGYGEKEDALKANIANYNSRNNILFLGDRNDVAEILAISDVFILPTEKEGMSNAIMEAMAAGKPIITTDIPENKNLIRNEETGILFPVNNAKSLQEAIESLMSNLNLRMKLGQNAQRKVEKEFDIQIIASRFAEFFEEI